VLGLPGACGTTDVSQIRLQLCASLRQTHRLKISQWERHF